MGEPCCFPDVRLLISAGRVSQVFVIRRLTVVNHGCWRTRDRIEKWLLTWGGGPDLEGPWKIRHEPEVLKKARIV